MSCDRRLLLTLLAALPVAACGFPPAYAPQGGADTLSRAVQVRAPEQAAVRDACAARVAARRGRAINLRWVPLPHQLPISCSH